MPRRTVTAVLLKASLLLGAGCRGEATPDDPRPPASAQAAVPSAAVSAWLELSATPAPAVASAVPPSWGGGGVPTPSGTVREDPPVLSRPALPPEVVRRITRQSFARFRLCYRAALTGDPTTTGTFVGRYVIAIDGSVSSAVDSGSALADPALVACVLAGLRRMSFPAPTGGAVTVTQTLYFTPPSTPSPPGAPAPP